MSCKVLDSKTEVWYYSKDEDKLKNSEWGLIDRKDETVSFYVKAGSLIKPDSEYSFRYNEVRISGWTVEVCEIEPSKFEGYEVVFGVIRPWASHRSLKYFKDDLWEYQKETLYEDDDPKPAVVEQAYNLGWNAAFDKFRELLENFIGED